MVDDDRLSYFKPFLPTKLTQNVKPTTFYYSLNISRSYMYGLGVQGQDGRVVGLTVKLTRTPDARVA